MKHFLAMTTLFTGNDFYNIGARLRFPDLLTLFACNKSIHDLSNDPGFLKEYLKTQFQVGTTFKYDFNRDLNVKKCVKLIYFFLLYAHYDQQYVTHVAFQKFLELTVEQQTVLVREMKNNHVDYKSEAPSHPFANGIVQYYGIMSNLEEFDLLDGKFDDYVHGNKDCRMLLYPTVVSDKTKLASLTDDKKEDNAEQLTPICVFDASTIQFNPQSRFWSGEFNEYTPTQLEFIKLVDTFVHRSTVYLSLDGCFTIKYDYEALEYILYSAGFKEATHKNLFKLINHVNDMYTGEFTIQLIRKFS